MKKEILDEMIKVASALDALGLYKEASNVDRAAQQNNFVKLIQTYKQFVEKKRCSRSIKLLYFCFT